MKNHDSRFFLAKHLVTRQVWILLDSQVNALKQVVCRCKTDIGERNCAHGEVLREPGIGMEREAAHNTIGRGYAGIEGILEEFGK